MGDYTVEFISSGGVFTDITNFVHEMGDTHFYSDGRISTSALTLQADFGQFITDSRGGSTPIIQQFDRIRLTYTDVDGNEYKHIFEVVNDMGQLTKQAKYLLPLTLEGRERNLSFIPFSGFFDPPLGHKQVSQKILGVYGFSKNSATQPTLLDTVNELEDFNPNFWDFQYIDNCLDALIEVLRSANLSVAAGGLNDRFAITYEDVDGDLNIMRINIISQGTTNTGDPFKTITGDPLYTPIQLVDKIKQPVTGTAIVARGRPGSGGMSRNGDIYRSKLEFYERFPTYNPNQTYKTGTFVTLGAQITNPEIPIGQVYEATADVPLATPPPNTSFWKTTSAEEYIGDVQYSPFTQDKALLYKNECTNPTAAFDSNSDTSPKMLDCNIVIDDDQTQRDWVYIRSNTDTVINLSAEQKKYLFEETDYYTGFRILVDVAGLGTGEGAFNPALDAFGTGAGNDPNGLPYANNAVIYIDNKWYVMKEHENFDQIVVRHEGVYEWNISVQAGSRYPANDANNATRRFRAPSGGTPDGWRPLAGQFLANDCLHSPKSITNVSGLATPIKKGAGFYSDNSAVRIVYQMGIDGLTEGWRKTLDQSEGFFDAAADYLTRLGSNATPSLWGTFTSPERFNLGWWITFTAPWPISTHNTIGEKVGELYGGKTLLELENHPWFDAYNQRVAFSGKAGWHEPDSADLMEITGVTFMFRLDIETNKGRIGFTGDIPVAYWVMDDNGTIWKSKAKYRHLGDPQRMTFDFGNFTPVYRARSPLGVKPREIQTNILVPELEIRERLIPSRIKLQGFQVETSYDEHGRYSPNFFENIFKPTIENLFNAKLFTFIRHTGDIDSFQWVKTPIAIETGANVGVTPDRVIFPDFREYPNITNIEQLQRSASGSFVTDFFQYEQYTFVQNDRADVALQDTIYLREDNLIPDADQSLSETNSWLTGTDYVVNDIVQEAGTIYECILTHTSDGTNQPPNTTFWNSLGTTSVPNTRQLVAGEIVLSVNNQRAWQRELTALRRIPQS